MNEQYTDEALEDAREAFKARHPDWQPNTSNDALEAAWISGYIACYNDETRLRDGSARLKQVVLADGWKAEPKGS